MKIPSRDSKKTHPIKEGLYHLKHWNGFEYNELEVEVYELPNSTLCVWAEELGIHLDWTMHWNTDEWLGHLPISTIEGTWFFIKPLYE